MHDAWCMMHDAWCMMHVCMMHISMILDPWSWYMHVWCIYLCSSLLDYTACVYDAHIYDPRSLTLIYVCMMHISMILDPWSWCMCVCMVHVSMMRYFSVTDQRTNGQGDSRSRIYICLFTGQSHLPHHLRHLLHLRHYCPYDCIPCRDRYIHSTHTTVFPFWRFCEVC